MFATLSFLVSTLSVFASTLSVLVSTLPSATSTQPFVSSALSFPADAAAVLAWPDLGPQLQLVGRAVVAFLVVYGLGRLIAVPVVERTVATRNRQNQTLAEAVGRYVRLGALLAAVVAAVAAVGYTDVIARSSVVVAAITVALGIAGQEVIGNVVSGLFLVADSNFNVGDYIVWNDREGVVQTISLRVTRVRTPDNEVLTVPNTELATTAVLSPFSERRYRVSEAVEVSYDAELDEVRRLLKRAARETPGALESPPPDVRFGEFGGDGIRLTVAFWLAEPARSDVATARWEFASRVRRLFAEADAGLSPPAERSLSGRIGVDADELGDENDAL